MSAARRILIVDDSADDAELTVRVLRRGGCELTYERVDTPEAMRAALERGNWDLVIADYSMPRFDGIAALRLLQERELDLPFILVSGTVGEDVAVQAMKAGAHDYVLKNNLARLPPAVERELRDAEVRRERRRAEARYRSLFDRVPVGVFSITPAGRVLDANPAFVEMLGFADVESLKRIDIARLWDQPKERTRLRALIAREGVVQNFEMWMRRQDGSTICCAQSARAVYGAGGKVDHYEGVSVDITERKRAEEEVKRARDLALEAVRLRSEFMHNMSHEIRTPLNGIIGSAELLALSELLPEQRRHAEIIQSSGELLLRIVNDILDFSRLSDGMIVLEQIDFDPIELVESLVDSFGGAARAKDLELALKVDISMPTGLRGDPQRLRQILSNLVSNAIKFTPAGEVLIRVTRVEESANDALMRFEVTDTGIGISPEVHSELFQPFVQADGSTNRRFGGTGLGLVISAQLTRQMGGEIGFDSEPDKGSKFHFTVRLAKGTEIGRPWMKPSAVSLFKRMRVLVVDTSLLSCRVISEYLSSWGIANVVLASGAEILDHLVLAAADNKMHAVVVLDEQLSNISGSSIARAIKSSAHGKDTKVVMLRSANSLNDSPEDVDFSITKPVRPSHLFNCLLALFLDSDHNFADSSQQVSPGTAGDGQYEWRKGIRVLVIDDNVTNRILIRQQLHVLGYTAEIVDGAPQGLEVLSREHCDIILMDCEMPEMDGYEGTAEIRRCEGDARHTVVIALTAHATEGDRERCLAAGMDDYLSKPVKLEKLAEVLDSWVGRGSSTTV